MSGGQVLTDRDLLVECLWAFHDLPNSRFRWPSDKLGARNTYELATAVEQHLRTLTPEASHE